MTGIKVRPLQDGLSFGARIDGVTFDTLEDPAVRAQINDVFEDRGMILFENVEPSSQMQLALSDVFGPLKNHPVKSQELVDGATMPGVIDMTFDPDKLSAKGAVELNGEQLALWLPWHFDHCYNNELNRAGVLRAVVVAPKGGFTKFADGVDLYERLSPALRKRIEGRNILYHLNAIGFDKLKYGRLKNWRVIQLAEMGDAYYAQAEITPRALHPAVWTRRDGRKVLHLSPWFAVGIEGQENEAGEALLEAVSQEINAKAETGAYVHAWKQTDMIIWDNWRMLHACSGVNPMYKRSMHRTTIKGDYGLGAFEGGGVHASTDAMS